MYEAFYGLRERPFDLTPNPRFLFMTPQHREALTTLEYGLSARTGIVLLVGDAGTGKTTIVHAALQSESARQNRVVYLNNPALTRTEFIEFLAASFGLSADAAKSKTRCLAELTQVLAERHAAGTMAALIIDEAQCLPDDLLEEIRLLANIESASEKLLSIVLSGQPELADRLNRPSLRQLKQRIGLRCALRALTMAQTNAYIAARVGFAGGDAGQIFTAEAMRAVHERSGGIPRTISVICDNALVTGFALDWRPVDEQVVLEVCRDFDFDRVIDAPDVEANRAPALHADAVDVRSHVATAEPPPAREPVAAHDGFFDRIMKGRSV
jgi:type II secretory pathway predicted ATPase ExeA